MAQQLAKKAGLVTYVATAQAAGDHKMLSRITANATEVRRLGYIGIEDNGVKARGHEFHYSAIDPLPGCARRALVEQRTRHGIARAQRAELGRVLRRNRDEICLDVFRSERGRRSAKARANCGAHLASG